MYSLVYFDGTVETMGVLLHVLKISDKRVWVKMHKSISNDYINFVKSLQDNYGSLCHRCNEEPYIRYHFSFGNRRSTIKFSNPIEIFCKHLSELNYERQEEILSKTIVCCKKFECEPCEICTLCSQTKTIAEEYGLYDIIPNTRVKSSVY